MRTIKFKSLSSGSCGNCYYLGVFGEDGHCIDGILIDAGVSPRRIKKELEKDGLGPDAFSCQLITHDHLDHIRSLGSCCKHIGKPVWSTAKLLDVMSRHYITGEYLRPLKHALQEGWNEVVPGLISVQYFEVPHDATQTVGYAILIDGYKFVIMTDLGRITKQAESFAKQADTVVIESNYDPDMLLHGPYPPELQDRIRDGHGHLSNGECAEAIKAFAHEGLRNVFLCHLSEHNNTPELARATSSPSLDASIRLAPLPRNYASPLFIL